MSNANLVSERIPDGCALAAVQKFLDENFYPKRPGGNSYAVRYDGRDMLLRGVDVRSGNDYMDEKLLLSSDDLNRVPGKVRLELSFVNRRGGVQDGCFLRKGITATKYLFVSVFTYGELPVADESSIALLFAMEVSRADLLRAIAVSGDPISYAAKTIREDWADGFIPFGHGRYGVERMDGVPERPVFLVIDHGWLKTLPSTREYSVDRDGVVPYHGNGGTDPRRRTYGSDKLKDC